MTFVPSKLLPYSATDVERNLQNLPIGGKNLEDRMRQAVDSIPTLKHIIMNSPDGEFAPGKPVTIDLISYMIYELGLSEIMSYLPDPQRLFKEGVQWQRIRGTPKSLRMIMEWLGLEDILITEGGIGKNFPFVQNWHPRIYSSQQLCVYGLGRKNYYACPY